MVLAENGVPAIIIEKLLDFMPNNFVHLIGLAGAETQTKANAR